jgi:cytochrome c553
MTGFRLSPLPTLLLACLPLGAGAGEDSTARSLAANCTSCHGPGGVSTGGIPSLAGRPKQALLESLQGFKAGTRPATVMHQHAKGYTDTELELLADYFAKQEQR